MKEAIRRLKSGKAPGPDRVKNETLEAVAKMLTKPLTNLFSKIIETERIPEQWKISKISILHKEGDRQMIENYRPISLTKKLRARARSLVRQTGSRTT